MPHWSRVVLWQRTPLGAKKFREQFSRSLYNSVDVASSAHQRREREKERESSSNLSNFISQREAAVKKLSDSLKSAERIVNTHVKWSSSTPGFSIKYVSVSINGAGFLCALLERVPCGCLATSRQRRNESDKFSIFQFVSLSLRQNAPSSRFRLIYRHY